MSSPALEVEVHQFAGTDAELLVNLDDKAREGWSLVAIHDRDNLRYLYFQRIIAPGQCFPYEQQRIDVGAEALSVGDVIRRESLAGWYLSTAYCGKDGVVQLFFARLVAPPDIEEKG